MGKYMELLKKARENNINVTDLFVVGNVIYDVMHSINEMLMSEEKIDELVESICNEVKWYYLKTNGLSISDISRAICELHFDENIPLDDIDRDMIYQQVESYY